VTSPRFARTTETNRFYDIPGYENVVFRSVTSRLNVISKPALYGWYAKVVAEAALFEPYPAYPGSQDDYLKYLKNKPREVSKVAQDLGTAVHKAVEVFVDSGVMPPEADQTHPYVQTFKTFLSESGMKVVCSERTVFSVEHGYAGTLDLILSDGCFCWIVDIKTGGVYPTASLQLTAYANASHILENSGATHENTVFCHGGFVLELKPNRYTVHYVDISDKQMDAFLSVCAVSDWDGETSNKVVSKTPFRQREEKQEKKESNKERKELREEKEELSSEVSLDAALDCASLLAAKIVTNMCSAGFKPKKMDTAKWALDIEKLHRLDGADYATIREVINWCQSDPFWKTNILSGSKLRAQFPQLVLKMGERKQSSTVSEVRFV
jgi:hypothetical protein